VAGRLDGIYRESDGTFVVGDTKSTAHLELASFEFAPQLAAYATAQWIELNGDGKGWSRMEVVCMGAVRTDYAIAFQVDRETGATAAYRVDLFLGAYGANLSGQVREYRKMGRAILAPYVRPEGQPEARGVATPPVAQERHLAAVPDEPPPLPSGSVQPPPVTESKLISAAELNRLTKAQVQEYARKVDPDGVGRDLAHQKAGLILRLSKAGKVTDSPASDGPKTDDPAEIAGRVNGSDPTDPRDPAFRAEVLRKLASASSVGELGTVHAYVVRRGGDQAWTDEMADAARGVANRLDAAYPNHAALSRVVACQSQEDIAALWTELTTGGSRPEGWSEEVDAAARERMRQIQAATPPAPANPYAP
jgi:hypothetical protein